MAFQGNVLGRDRDRLRREPPERQEPTTPPTPPDAGQADKRACNDKHAACGQRCYQQFGGSGPGFDRCMERCDRQLDRCLSGQEQDEEPAAECPPESKDAKPYAGTGNCPCGSRFDAPSSSYQCPSGYRMVQGSKGPSCRCEDWCKEGLSKGTLSGACTGTGGGEGGTEGQQFELSPELQALWARIMDRANQLLSEPRGLSEEERNAIYNRAFEKIKGAERPAIQSAQDRASRMGMLYSPYAGREVSNIQRGSRELLGATARDIELEETQRRFDEEMKVLAMVNAITGQKMTAEQMIESLNAARRGEGYLTTQNMLSYFNSLMGGQSNNYWQMIMNWLSQSA